ncbi:MAG: ROK family protein [Verrucomicrobiales bacterium]|nr:ROK family protein [Verrucomicrobiales bacterium]
MAHSARMREAIGIDLGGTLIKAARVDLASGAILQSAVRPTRDGEQDADGLPMFVQGARECIEELEAESERTGLSVGMSAPGVASPHGDCIRWMPGRMHGIEGLNWEQVLGRRVVVLNDAHAALLGEVWMGAAQGCADVFMLTLGTGVGGAVMSGGRLLKGKLGRAGHLGHISIDWDGEPDVFGTPGSLEQAVAGQSLLRRSAGRYATTEELVAAVQAGDEEAAKVWRQSVRALAVGIASLVNVLDPERVIVGGGIASGASEALLRPLKEELRSCEWRLMDRSVPILPATAGSYAGVLGAVWALVRGI